MADNSASIKVSVEGVAKAKKDFNDLAASVKALSAENKAIQAEFRATGDEQTYLEKTYDNLTRTMAVHKKQVEAAQKALETLKKSDKASATEIANWQARLATANAGLYETQAAMNTVRSRVEELGGSFVDAGDSAREAAASTGRVGQSFDTSGVKTSVGAVKASVEEADDSAGKTKEGIDQIGGSVDQTNLDTSVGSIDTAIQSADDSAADTKKEIDKIGGSVDQTNLDASVGKIDTSIQGADDSAAATKGEIDKLGGPITDNGLNSSVEGIDSKVKTADDSAADTKKEIDKLGGTINHSNLDTSISGIDSEIQGADDSAEATKSEIDKLGGSIDHSGLDTSVGGIDTAVQSADDSAADTKAEIDKIGGSFGTSGVESSANTVHNKILWSGKGADDAKEEIAGVGEGFDTSGVEGSAGDVDKAVEGADDSADETKDELNKIGQAIDTKAALDSLEKIESKVKSLAKHAAGAAKSLISMGVNAGQWADELSTTASQMGIDTETLQRMQYASRFVDTDVSTIQAGAKRVSRSRDDKTWLEEIKELEKLSGEKIELIDENGARASLDIMLDIVDALATIQENGGAVEELASNLLGNSWDQFRPMIDAGGAEAYRDTMAEANVVSAENVAALAAVDDANQQAQASFENLKNEVMAGLAPAFEEGAKTLTEFVEKLRDFVQSEEGQAAINALSQAMTDLINTFASEDNVSTIFTAIQTAIESLQAALQWISENSGTVIDAVTKIAEAFGLLKVSEAVLTFMQLGQAAKNLFGGGGKNTGDSSGGGGGSGNMSVISRLAKKGVDLVKNHPEVWPLMALGAEVMSPVAGVALGYVADKKHTEATYGDFNRQFEKKDEIIGEYAAKTEEMKAEVEKANEDLQTAIDTAPQMGQRGEEILDWQRRYNEGRAEGEKIKEDGIAGEETVAAGQNLIQELQTVADEADTKGIEVREHLQKMLEDAFTVGDLGSDDLYGGIKDLWDNYAKELEQMFPEMDIWEEIKQRMGGDTASQWSFEDLMSNGITVGGWFETFATDVATELSTAMENGFEGSEGIATTAASTLAGQATEQAQTDLTTGGQTGGSGFDEAIAAAIMANAALVQSAAAQLGTEAAAAFDAAYKSSISSVPAGYGSGGRNSSGSTGGGGNVNVSLNIDGREFARTTAPYMDRELGRSVK